MSSHIYRIKGMHCASCAGIIERTVKKVDGVENIQVNYGTETAKIAFDEAKTKPKDFDEDIPIVNESTGLDAALSDVKTPFKEKKKRGRKPIPACYRKLSSKLSPF